MPKNKRIRLFAGPNGSGKTTLFFTLSQNYNVGHFINADLIEKDLSEKGLFDVKSFDLLIFQSDLDQFKLEPQAISLIAKARLENLEIDLEVRENFIVNVSKITNSYESAFAAAFLRTILLKKNKSFSFETVMSHTSKLDELKAAKDNGYLVYLYFVCIDDPDLNISRIENRVDKGGHHVNPDKIISRYKKTLNNLFEAIKLSYRAYLFDNSGKEQVMIAEFFNGSLELKVDAFPLWFTQYVLPHFASPEQ